MLIVLIVGTVNEVRTIVSQPTNCQGQQKSRTHHQALDILHPRILDALAHQDDTNARPSEEQAAERDGDEPVQRRELVGASEDDVQRRGIDDEHAQAGTSEDASEVVVVADDVPAEGERELRLYSEDVEALDDEDG